MHKICKIANKHCRTRYTHIHPYIIRHVRFTAMYVVKFIYSEKAIKFCENLHRRFVYDLSYVVTVKCTVEISQNFMAFSEYMNFSRSNDTILESLYSHLCGTPRGATAAATAKRA